MSYGNAEPNSDVRKRVFNCYKDGTYTNVQVSVTTNNSSQEAQDDAVFQEVMDLIAGTDGWVVAEDYNGIKTYEVREWVSPSQ